MEFYTNVFTNKNKLFHIGYNDEGKFIREVDFQPHLAILSNKQTGYKTYLDEPVEMKYFDGVKDFFRYRKEWGNTFALYDDIDPAYQFIVSKYPNTINYNLSKIKILFYDIETSPNPETGEYSPAHEALGPITSIAIKDIHTQRHFLISTEKFYPEQISVDYTGIIHYKFCYSEQELLKTFVLLIDKIKPDIMSGYNSQMFDDPYIINRCNIVLGDYAKKLSPIRGKVESSYKHDEDGKIIYNNKIEGVALIDFMLLYQKNIGKYESNSLSFVAGVELGEDKVNYEEYDNLEELRIKNPQKFLEYNMIDVELLDKINKKRKLIELIIAVAYFSKSNFEDIMSPIRTWDNFIYDYLNKQNIVIPPRKSTKASLFHVPGGYVKTDVVPGIYKDVISLDLKSLYPSLSITLNISPDTIIEKGNHNVRLDKIDNKILNKEIVHNENSILTGSGWKFRKDKIGFYPALFMFLLDTRDEVKKKKIELEKNIQTFKGTEEEKLKLTNEFSNLHTFEQAIKLLSNSGYGILANKHCRYADARLAASITLSGQLAIKSAGDVVSSIAGGENTILFTHTDSFFLDVSKKANGVDEIDNFYKEKLAPVIEKCYLDLCKYLNTDKNFLILKREKICSHFLISAPSRYACLLVDKEGVRYKEPKLEITGMEIVRSSTPKIIKPYLKETLVKFMKDEDVLGYTEIVKGKFFKMNVEDIAFPRSANNLAKWVDSAGNYRSGIPIGVRAALNYNRVVEHYCYDMNKVTEGTKIKYVYMKTPNPFFNENVLGFIRKFPDPENNKKYVDYKLQFDKVYMDVVKSVAENIKFDLNKNKETLEDLF